LGSGPKPRGNDRPRSPHALFRQSPCLQDQTGAGNRWVIALVCNAELSGGFEWVEATLADMRWGIREPRSPSNIDCGSRGKCQRIRPSTTHPVGPAARPPGADGSSRLPVPGCFPFFFSDASRPPTGPDPNSLGPACVGHQRPPCQGPISFWPWPPAGGVHRRALANFLDQILNPTGGMACSAAWVVSDGRPA